MRKLTELAIEYAGSWLANVILGIVERLQTRKKAFGAAA